MGCKNTKQSDNSNSTTFPFRMSSFYVDMSNTFAKDKNINRLVEYFFTKHNNYEMDVMCLQGIESISIYKDIVRAFKKKINEINKHNPDNTTEIYFYPYDNNSASSDEYETWSLSDQTSDDESAYCKLIISRHKSIMYIEDNKYTKKLGRRKSFKRMNTLSYFNDLSSNNKNEKIQVVNMNINGIIISVYNISITLGFNGSNMEYNDKIKNLNNFIDVNNQEILNYCNLDNNNLDNRSIHFLCGSFGINEMKNNSVNKSYVTLVKKLHTIDIFRYVTGIRGKNSLKYKYDTNILFSRNNYLLMHVDNIDKLDDIKTLGKEMYRNYGVVVIDTNINQFVRDLFIHFPTDAVVLFDKEWRKKKNNSTNGSHDSNEVKYENIDFTTDEFRDIIVNNRQESCDTESTVSNEECIELDEISINDNKSSKTVKVKKVKYCEDE